jgi:uncharacterized protein (DUF1330 family)
MAKDVPGYLVATVRVDDPETYSKYTGVTPKIIADHGGRFLVRGGPVKTLEGEAFTHRLVVVEFPSVAAAQAFYDSPDYAEVMRFRHASADSVFLLVEGVPPDAEAPDARVVKST